MNSKIYEIELAPGVQKDIKNFSKELLKELKDKHLETIKKDPFQYPRLKGKYNKFRKYRIYYKKTEYRIIYYVEGKIIKILVIESREGVYKKLKNKFKQYL